jgi:hypothetical protein
MCTKEDDMVTSLRDPSLMKTKISYKKSKKWKLESLKRNNKSKVLKFFTSIPEDRHEFRVDERHNL